MGELTIHNEPELMDQFRQGKEVAMSVIFDSYSRPLFYFALRYVQHTAEAEDAAAEAFIKLWNQKGEFQTINSVALFLHTTVKNRCLDYLRHKSVKTNHRAQLIRIIEQSDVFDASDEIVRMQLMDKVYAEVAKMPEKMREVFYLSYKEGLKPQQVAERLQISVQTVKNQKVNAIKLLKRSFKDYPHLVTLLALMELEIFAVTFRS